MIVVEEVIDKGLMTGIEEDVLLLDLNPGDIILLEVLITATTITTTEVIAGNPNLEVHPDLYQETQSCI